MTSEHRIPPHAIARYRRSVALRTVGIMIFAFLAITAVAVAQSASIVILVFVALMIALVTATNVIRSARRIEEELGGYAIRLEPDRLVRLPNTAVERGAVTRIEERRGGGLAVYAGEIAVLIPEMVEGYAAVRERLAEWHSIELK